MSMFHLLFQLFQKVFLSVCIHHKSEIYEHSYQNQKLFTRAYPNIQFKGKNWKAAVLKLLDEGWLPIYMSEGAYYQWTNPDKNAVTKALPLRTKSDIMITYKALAES